MAPVPAYADALVFERIRDRFPYVFEGGQGRHGFWRPEIAPHPIDGPFRIGPVEVVPFRQKHGRGESWGFRFGPFAYSTDTDGLDEAAFAALRGVEVWIVDALRDAPHPSHAHLDLTLGLDRAGAAAASLPDPHEPRGRLRRLGGPAARGGAAGPRRAGDRAGGVGRIEAHPKIRRSTGCRVCASLAPTYPLGDPAAGSGSV
jgi:hypothetical protein